MGELDHLADADDLLALVRVIEEAEVAHGHLAHVVAGLEVAHAGPRLALFALGDEVVPREGVGFGFEQPVGHCARDLVLIEASVTRIGVGLMPLGGARPFGGLAIYAPADRARRDRGGFCLRPAIHAPS